MLRILILCLTLALCGCAEKQTLAQVDAVALEGFYLKHPPAQGRLAGMRLLKKLRPSTVHTQYLSPPLQVQINPAGECCRIVGRVLTVELADGSSYTIRSGDEVSVLKEVFQPPARQSPIRRNGVHRIKVADGLLLVTTSVTTRYPFGIRMLRRRDHVVSDFVLVGEAHQRTECRFSQKRVEAQQKKHPD